MIPRVANCYVIFKLFTKSLKDKWYQQSARILKAVQVSTDSSQHIAEPVIWKLHFSTRWTRYFTAPWRNQPCCCCCCKLICQPCLKRLILKHLCVVWNATSAYLGLHLTESVHSSAAVVSSGQSVVWCQWQFHVNVMYRPLHFTLLYCADSEYWCCSQRQPWSVRRTLATSLFTRLWCIFTYLLCVYHFYASLVWFDEDGLNLRADKPEAVMTMVSWCCH